MGAMSGASSLRTLREIPSGPEALLGLRLVNSFSTPCSVTVKLGMAGLQSALSCIMHF